MRFKEKWKRFWTLSRRSEGFTLVELIVVIAILGILAGVAVPAYSGYIQKADMAADQVLLDSINTAFASACAVNGENHYNRTDRPKLLDTAGENRVTGIDAGSNDALEAAFANFFNNTESKFKVMKVTGLSYDKTLGGFTMGMKVTINGVDYSIPPQAMADFKKSYYGDDSQMSTSQLTSSVGYVVEIAEDHLETIITGNDEFEEFYAALSKPDGIDEETAKANAMVLYVAQKSGDMSAEELLGAVRDGGTTWMITQSNDNYDQGEKMAITAMQYALGMAYLKATDPDAQPTTTAVINAMKTKASGGYDDWGNPIDDPQGRTNFQIWLEDPENAAQANINGYLGALNIIAQNQEQLDTSKLLKDGYNTEDVRNLIDEAKKAS